MENRRLVPRKTSGMQRSTIVSCCGDCYHGVVCALVLWCA